MGIQKVKQMSWEIKHRVDRWNWSLCRSRVEDTNNYGEESGLVMAIVDNDDGSFFFASVYIAVLYTYLFYFSFSFT